MTGKYAFLFGFAHPTRLGAGQWAWICDTCELIHYGFATKGAASRDASAHNGREHGSAEARRAGRFCADCRADVIGNDPHAPGCSVAPEGAL